ncbi:lipopolysaccharide transport periplasmic protein LptA [Mesobacterium pallidum]|uniref:lipopolysaccharide transport periplasmic protein LptA n=1 Tax=Mesobacterium pallidum TaxID=2872037 RepID=UPI001EE35E71|nr:lipopolysaccharide transport periplasmic protein LptA [Mesobacterium pallidum]
MLRRAALAALLTLATTLPTHTLAQGTTVGFGDGAPADTSGPVEVTANSLQLNRETGTATFEGDVFISQGDMKLWAPKVLVRYSGDGNDVTFVEATGGVTMSRGDEAAEGDRAEYDVTAKSIMMSGNVLLTQGPNALAGERMRIDLETGTAEMLGRVRTVIGSE